MYQSFHNPIPEDTYALNIIQGSFEWLQRRRKYITGTDMAMVVREESWQRLLDSKLNPKTFRSKAMIRGNHFEPEARSMLSQKTGLNYMPVVMVNDKRGMQISLDGMTFGRRFTCEIKVPEKGEMSKLWADAKSGKMSRAYYLQVQSGLLVTGAAVCHYWVYCPESRRGVLVDVEPDRDAFREILQSTSNYWKSDYATKQKHSLAA